MTTPPDTRKRAHKNQGRRRHWIPWVAGITLGSIAGFGLASPYPPPSTAVLNMQAVEWYQHMRNLVLPNDDNTTNNIWVGDPKIYGTSPINLPPEALQRVDYVTDDAPKILNVNAPIPDENQLATAIQQATEQLELEHRLYVVDAATGQPLYDSGATDTIVPASTLKLFTAVNILTHLDINHRFTTKATYEPATGISLIGGGDALLATGNSTTETVGYAGLADLAQDTWDAIQTDLNTSVVTVQVDVSRYPQPRVHSTWTDGLMTGGRVSPIYPINTWGGLYTNPEHDMTAVEDGAANAGYAFIEHLNNAAATANQNITFQYGGLTTETTTAEPVAQVHSATVGAQLEYAMKQSNNMLFETLGREAALAADATPDFTGSTNSTITTLQELGLDVGPLHFEDNSGLSNNNRATLKATTDVLELLLVNETYRPILQTLTIAGYDGTMRHRMDHAPYSGVVRTKTGTLEVASSNAGLTVTKDGRTLWFAINTTGADGDYATARSEQDHIVKVITDCGCNTN